MRQDGRVMSPVRARKEAGMSLLGVLVVIVVLGAVASIAYLKVQQSPWSVSGPAGTPTVGTSAKSAPSVPGITGAISAMQVVACQQLLAQVQSAISIYAVEHGGSNPADLSALVPGLLKTDPAKALAAGQKLSYVNSTGVVTGKCR